jgi:uncharacterized protein
LSIWLVDAGPLVAYLDARDPAHSEVANAIDWFAGELVSTGAVVTEAMHFIGGSRRGPVALAEFVVASGMKIADVCQPTDLRHAAALMTRYADTPMDFADATLVLLAEAIGVRDVLTIDRRGFSTYRTSDRKGFRLVLDS